MLSETVISHVILKDSECLFDIEKKEDPMSTNGEQVNIFISHKHEDEQTAFRIRDILKALDDSKFPRINFFYPRRYWEVRTGTSG